MAYDITNMQAIVKSATITLQLTKWSYNFSHLSVILHYQLFYAISHSNLSDIQNYQSFRALSHWKLTLSL